ncbi:WD repeat protein 35 [Aphelenchoides avenae]|nr:WD repeat protein 35 [Aphelenchus avenae]
MAEYEDLLDPLEVNSMLALASCNCKQFSVCSKAFMKLESMRSLVPEEKQGYRALAMKIFVRNPPKDTRQNKVDCTNCGTSIPDYALVCPNPSCDTRFPVCIVSGRPLFDYQFWLCPSCKHRAYEQEIQSYKFCPLCHYEI